MSIVIIIITKLTESCRAFVSIISHGSTCHSCCACRIKAFYFLCEKNHQKNQINFSGLDPALLLSEDHNTPPKEVGYKLRG